MIDPTEWFNASVENAAVYWTVPANLPYFDGHFPGRPILPAVAMIDFSLCAIAKAHAPVQLVAVTSAKFLAPVEPGLKVQIRLSNVEGKRWRIEWLGFENAHEKTLADIALEVAA